MLEEPNQLIVHKIDTSRNVDTPEVVTPMLSIVLCVLRRHEPALAIIATTAVGLLRKNQTLTSHCAVCRNGWQWVSVITLSFAPECGPLNAWRSRRVGAGQRAR